MLARFVCVLVLCGMLAACATPATPAATGLSATDPVAPDRAIVILGVRQHERAVALEPYISLQFSLAQFGAEIGRAHASMVTPVRIPETRTQRLAEGIPIRTRVLDFYH